MKLVMHCFETESIPCVDWPTALVALMCRGSPYWVERENPAPGKSFIASMACGDLFVTRWIGDGQIKRLTPEEIDRLMAGEDL